MPLSCSPHTVSVASDCYYWCELPAYSELALCLVRHGMEPGIVGLHMGSAAGPMAGRKLVGLVAWAPLFAIALHL
ncbi:hypothetical protein CGRA01v4_12558 [Colletotrichum graminicola]|nr:hypothetical protein CGRA01v4_12558 [Colletotrichum graminicola]